MLYQPAHFEVNERALALELIREHPLATLVSVRDGDVAVTHVPLVAQAHDDAVMLLGHMARANPHWRALSDGERVTAIFRGPDSYVSPAWYARIEAVPTWNYVVVHAGGTIRMRHDSAAKERLLKALIDVHDPPYRARWDEALSEDFRERQKSAIVGFEIDVERLHAKFKLSQNRLAVDRAGVLAAMERDEGPRGADRAALGRWMRRLGIGT
jgi:transcriptional regulator